MRANSWQENSFLMIYQLQVLTAFQEVLRNTICKTDYTSYCITNTFAFHSNATLMYNNTSPMKIVIHVGVICTPQYHILYYLQDNLRWYTNCKNCWSYHQNILAVGTIFFSVYWLISLSKELLYTITNYKLDWGNK